MSHSAPSDYYNRINTDLLQRIPRTVSTVVEIGCGAGALGASFKRDNPAVWYAGVELEESAAAVARERLDQVVTGSAEELRLDQLGLDGRPLECLVYGDVLEHLYDPWATLARHTEWLAPGGEVVACVPNIQHWSILLDLLRGRWAYQQEGLLDITHLRFFTLEGALDLFARAGLRVEEVVGRKVGFDDPRVQGSFATFRQLLTPLLENLEIPARNFEEQAGSLQYLIRGRRA